MPKKMEGIASGQGNEEGVPLFLLISPRREAKKKRVVRVLFGQDRRDYCCIFEFGASLIGKYGVTIKGSFQRRAKSCHSTPSCNCSVVFDASC